VTRTARTRSEEVLLASLAAGDPVERAAQVAGLSQRTAYRRLNDPGFQQRLAHARDELVREALAGLASSASDAVRTLQRLLTAESEHVQLRAARTVLEQLLRLRETLELADRVSALERQAERTRGRR
jgi:hypothetical protein